MLLSLCYFKKELVLQAVQKDQEGERSAALSLYCSALEHFVPAIHCKGKKHFHILSVAEVCYTVFYLHTSNKMKTNTNSEILPLQMRQTDSVKMPCGRR